MKLVEGKITLANLETWLGVSAGTLRNNKSKYLNILARYCRYHEEGTTKKTLYIDEVYEAEYSALQGPKPYQRVKELTKENWSGEGLDSCALVASRNFPILQQEGYTITENTSYNYTCQSRTELWGSPMKRTNGELGYSRYEYCKVGPQGQLVPLNEEEQKIKRQVTEKYFGNLEDFTLGIADDIKKGKITAEEAGLALANLGSHGEYLAWKNELEARLGCKIYKGTRVYEEESAF